MPTNAVSTPDEIWKILEGTNATLDKTNATLDKTNATLDKTSREMAEFRISQEESSRKVAQEIEEIRAIQRETVEEMKETDRRMKETDKQIKKTEALFNTQWGRLMESLVEGDLLSILQQKGIDVSQTYRNVEKRGYGDDYEYDIIAANGQEVVVVEVKTTLRVKDVQDFLISLRKFTTRMPQHRRNTIYGAVAWLRAQDEAAAYAEKQGLFVIRATGSSASIVNREDFKPQVFS